MKPALLALALPFTAAQSLRSLETSLAVRSTVTPVRTSPQRATTDESTLCGGISYETGEHGYVRFVSNEPGYPNLDMTAMDVRDNYVVTALVLSNHQRLKHQSVLLNMSLDDSSVAWVWQFPGAQLNSFAFTPDASVVAVGALDSGYAYSVTVDSMAAIRRESAFSSTNYDTANFTHVHAIDNGDDPYTLAMLGLADDKVHYSLWSADYDRTCSRELTKIDGSSYSAEPLGIAQPSSDHLLYAAQLPYKDKSVFHLTSLTSCTDLWRDESDPDAFVTTYVQGLSDSSNFFIYGQLKDDSFFYAKAGIESSDVSSKKAYKGKDDFSGSTILGMGASSNYLDDDGNEQVAIAASIQDPESKERGLILTANPSSLSIIDGVFALSLQDENADLRLGHIVSLGDFQFLLGASDAQSVMLTRFNLSNSYAGPNFVVSDFTTKSANTPHFTGASYNRQVNKCKSQLMTGLAHATNLSRGAYNPDCHDNTTTTTTTTSTTTTTTTEVTTTRPDIDLTTDESENLRVEQPTTAIVQIRKPGVLTTMGPLFNHEAMVIGLSTSFGLAIVVVPVAVTIACCINKRKVALRRQAAPAQQVQRRIVGLEENDPRAAVRMAARMAELARQAQSPGNQGDGDVPDHNVDIPEEVPMAQPVDQVDPDEQGANYDLDAQGFL